jgi:hypothetical protein
MADRDDDEKDDDVSSEPPESKARSKRDRDDDEDEEEEAPRPKKKSLAKNTRKGASADKPRQKPKEREKESAKQPEPSSSSNLVWVALLAVIALGAWWIFKGPSTKDEPAPVRSETPTAPTVAQAPKPEQPAGGPEEPAPAPTPEPEAPSASAEPTPSAPPPAGGGGSFDRAVALDALAKSGAKAAGCRMRGEPAGTANVTVTFEPSGKVKEAEIRSGAFSGSPTGKCIIKKLMETTIAPFTGEAGKVIAPVSVR